ncbi:hypothetical protein F5876DRAFT_83246 [Lentinula aff. lateritia]|uniref:Uncharacterized protein n=1 Tax=Lentinula aff. lateritia TaxID=2804960 RepID=A0ACC1TIP6_9AGAR|nr:hypothetical protein F5876DRAFT_83246 [Lentinula aff. lateritia]
MSEPSSATQAPTGHQTAPAGPPATSAPTPLSNDWGEEPDCFLVCRHTCPHPRANQAGGTLRWAFTFVRNVSTPGHEHTKSGKHPHCSQACLEFGQTRRETEGLRDAAIAKKFRATILYSQVFHGSEVKNKAMLQWYQRVQEGHVFCGAWLGLSNSAPTFPRFVDLAFSDGALGPPSTDAWAQLPRQYEDIPTQLNQNIQCFDLQTVKAGNPVFGPGTQILTTPLILFGPSMTRLTVNFPAPAPSSSSNVSGSRSNPPIPPALTTAALPGPTSYPPPAPLVLVPSTSSGILPIQLTFTFEMPEPQNLKPLQSTWHSQGKELPKHILFVLSKIQGARKSLKTLKQADKGVVANFYECIIQWDLAAPHRVQFLHLLEKSIPLQHYMYVDYSMFLKRCDIYLFEWITLALELNDAGVIVSFIDNDDFIELLEKRELSKHWQLLKGVDLVIGRGELDLSSIPPQKIYTGVEGEDGLNVEPAITRDIAIQITIDISFHFPLFLQSSSLLIVL